MCFSATASFIASGVTGGVGVLTLRKAKSKSEIPLAIIPILFGVQQLVEGVLWLSFSSPLLNAVTTYIYSLFSHVLWPIFVPLAVFLVEENKTRKKILAVFLALGTIVGLYLLYFIIRDPVTSRIVNNSIEYTYHHHFPGIALVLYFIVTCLSCLISSNKIINFIGILLVISFFYAFTFYQITFFSVWCFLAAIISLVIYYYFRKKYKS